MLCTLIGTVALFALLVQLLYLCFLEIVLRRPPRGRHILPTAPVTVLICAREEAINLQKRLPAILEQDYKNYEVLVVDDGSEDDTEVVIRQWQKRYSHLRYRKVNAAEKAFAGKKGALQMGVAEASHEILLLTDADCVPSSPFWIEKMVAAMDAQKEIVVGYGPYEGAPGRLNAFIRAETLLSFLNIKAFHRIGIHYMAVGRNLCVRKQTFLRASQHPLWTRTLSGDDDMLMRICAKPDNVAVTADPETYLYSPAQPDFKSYIRQKQRHLSTGKYYRFPIKMLLALLSASHTLNWLLWPVVAVCAFVDSGMMAFPALGLALLRMLIFTGVFSKQAQRHRGHFSPLYPVAFDAVYALYPLFFAPYIFWRNKDQWT